MKSSVPNVTLAVPAPVTADVTVSAPPSTASVPLLVIAHRPAVGRERGEGVGPLSMADVTTRRG
jgi:hypothetical protein